MSNTTTIIGKNINGSQKYIAYVRVSTKAQSEVLHGSPEQQKNMIKRFVQKIANDQKIEIILTFVEEAVSGTDESFFRRTGFHSILRSIQNREIHALVAEKVDRLGRSQNHLNDLVKIATENDVAIIEAESGRSINMRDRGSRIGFKINAFLSEEYSNDLKEKITKKQREARFNNGKDINSIPCLGLDPHPSKVGFFVHNEIERLKVLRIAEKCIELGGIGSELVDFCKANNFKTKLRWTKEKVDKNGLRILPQQVGGEDFDIKKLHQLLSNPKLRGSNKFKDDWNQFPNQRDKNGFVEFKYDHAPVIPIELFDQVQFVLKSKAEKYWHSGTKQRIYLLSGILFTKTGIKFHGVSANRGQNLYYQTRDKSILIQKTKLDSLILVRVKQYIKEKGLLDNIVNTAVKNRLSGLPLLEEQIKELSDQEKKLELLVSKFTEKIREFVLLDSQNLKTVIDTLNVEKCNAEQDLQKIKGQIQDLVKRKLYINYDLRTQTFQEIMTKAINNFEKQALPQNRGN